MLTARREAGAFTFMPIFVACRLLAVTSRAVDLIVGRAVAFQAAAIA